MDVAKQQSMTLKPQKSSASPRRILLLGATGTIGRATAQALAARGHQVVCLVRRSRQAGLHDLEQILGPDSRSVEMRFGEVTCPNMWDVHGLAEEGFDAFVSCLASRTGAAKDAWAIDYQAHADALAVAKEIGVSHFVLLSAICVQKPELQFQKAKLAFEDLLIASGLTYSIVRPTAYFKSLSGQIERLRQGKPFLLFGSGELTSCKPISDFDLAAFIADSLCQSELHNKILPVGGPGSPITPREQGEMLFELLRRPAKFRSVPISVINAITLTLSAAEKVAPSLSDKAEFARIARYYATESMLIWDTVRRAYSAEATPSYGTDTLADHYRSIIEEGKSVSLGDHAMF